MPKLLLMKGNEAISSFDLAEGKIVVGRDADCEIQLDDEAISRHHLRVITLMGDAFLEDLGSSNGTFVNGKLSQKCALSDGDVIQVGQKELRFIQPEDLVSAPAGAGKIDATQIIRPGDFGPATKEAQEKNRSSEGISPVSLAAQQAKPSRMRPEPSNRQPKYGGIWAWVRRIFS